MKSLFSGRRVLVFAGLALVAMAGASFTWTKMNGKSSQPEAAATQPITKHAPPRAASEPPSADAGAGRSTPPPPTDVTQGSPGAPAPMPSQPIAGAELMAVAGQDLAPQTLPAMATEDDVFKRRKYTYKSLGRTDPFVSLIAGTDADLEQLDPQTLKLVGILEKGGSRRALVEDARGFGYILHRGDPVARGIVDEVGPDFLVITHSMYGITETVTLTLRTKGQGGSPNGSLN